MSQRVYLKYIFQPLHLGGYTRGHQNTAESGHRQSPLDPVAARLPKGRCALGATHHGLNRFTRAPRAGRHLAGALEGEPLHDL